MTHLFKLAGREARLIRLLKENAGCYHIDKNGIVSINWNSPVVQARIQRHITEASRTVSGEN